MKHRKSILIVTVLVVTVAGLAAFRGRILPDVLLTPLQEGAAAAGDWLDETLLTGQWRKRWQESQTELVALREQLAEADSLRRENACYREFLSLREIDPELKMTPARIIASDPADPYGGFSLNVGTLDGVAVGDPVVTAAGLAGVVARAGLSRAEVHTLLHPSVHVSATVSRTGEQGMTEGNGALLSLTALSRECAATAGDLAVTSGWGGGYPADLLIGYLEQPAGERDGIAVSAVIRPFYSAVPSQTVMVVTDFKGKAEN